MGEWERSLPPRLRERLEKVGELTTAEKERIREKEELDRCCAHLLRGEMDEEALFKKLKEYEAQDRHDMLRQARERLKGVASGRKLGLVIEETGAGHFLVRKLTEAEKKKTTVSVVELDSAGFGLALKDYTQLVVDCWAAWCAPCKMMAPVFEELASEFSGRVTFAKLNVDQNKDIAAKYEVMSIPTLLMFKDGQLADRLTGALPRDQMAARIEAVFPAN
jgi:thioredoxin 1